MRLNLVRLLKGLPEGYELYSLIYGEVLLIGIDEDSMYPISFKVKDSDIVGRVDAYGRVLSHPDLVSGECTLFPSKSKRDWRGFNNTCYFTGDFTYFKDDNGVRWVSIFRETSDYVSSTYVSLNLDTGELIYDLAFLNSVYTPKIATEAQSQLLLYELIKDGKYWSKSDNALINVDNLSSDIKCTLINVIHNVKWKLKSILD